MSAPLAINASYLVYPAGVAAAEAGVGYDQYYWHPLEETEPGPCSEGLLLAQEASGVPKEKSPPNNADLSPRTSSSEAFTFYTPDSATSPNRQPPSPQPSSASRKEESAEGRRVKTRTAFSQEQLQILHHRFRNQKYLCPQQIRELASALELTYKQIKTWFQNQRMKLKRTQKETLWTRKGLFPSQNGYLDINPSYHQGYSSNDGRNIYPLTSVHENYPGNQNYSSNQNYGSDHQLYGSPQTFYPIASGEDGSFFGKGAGACYSQQAIGYVSQQKMNFYHGFSASVEYAAVKMEDSYPFPNISPTAAALPGTSVLQHYQTPLQIQGAQSNSNP